MKQTKKTQKINQKSKQKQGLKKYVVWEAFFIDFWTNLELFAVQME